MRHSQSRSILRRVVTRSTLADICRSTATADPQQAPSRRRTAATTRKDEHRVGSSDTVDVLRVSGRHAEAARRAGFPRSATVGTGDARLSRRGSRRKPFSAATLLAVGDVTGSARVQSVATTTHIVLTTAWINAAGAEGPSGVQGAAGARLSPRRPRRQSWRRRRRSWPPTGRSSRSGHRPSVDGARSVALLVSPFFIHGMPSVSHANLCSFRRKRWCGLSFQHRRVAQVFLKTGFREEEGNSQ